MAGEDQRFSLWDALFGPGNTPVAHPFYAALIEYLPKEYKRLVFMTTTGARDVAVRTAPVVTFSPHVDVDPALLLSILGRARDILLQRGDSRTVLKLLGMVAEGGTWQIVDLVVNVLQAIPFTELHLGQVYVSLPSLERMVSTWTTITTIVLPALQTLDTATLHTLQQHAPQLQHVTSFSLQLNTDHAVEHPCSWQTLTLTQGQAAATQLLHLHQQPGRRLHVQGPQGPIQLWVSVVSNQGLPAEEATRLCDSLTFNPGSEVMLRPAYGHPPGSLTQGIAATLSQLTPLAQARLTVNLCQQQMTTALWEALTASSWSGAYVSNDVVTLLATPCPALAVRLQQLVFDAPVCNDTLTALLVSMPNLEQLGVDHLAMEGAGLAHHTSPIQTFTVRRWSSQSWEAGGGQLCKLPLPMAGRATLQVLGRPSHTNEMMLPELTLQGIPVAELKSLQPWTVTGTLCTVRLLVPSTMSPENKVLALQAALAQLRQYCPWVKRVCLAPGWVLVPGLAVVLKTYSLTWPQLQEVEYLCHWRGSLTSAFDMGTEQGGQLLLFLMETFSAVRCTLLQSGLVSTVLSKVPPGPCDSRALLFYGIKPHPTALSSWTRMLKDTACLTYVAEPAGPRAVELRGLGVCQTGVVEIVRGLPAGVELYLTRCCVDLDDDRQQVPEGVVEVREGVELYIHAPVGTGLPIQAIVSSVRRSTQGWRLNGYKAQVCSMAPVTFNIKDVTQFNDIRAGASMFRLGTNLSAKRPWTGVLNAPDGILTPTEALTAFRLNIRAIQLLDTRLHRLDVSGWPLRCDMLRLLPGPDDGYSGCCQLAFDGRNSWVEDASTLSVPWLAGFSTWRFGKQAPREWVLALFLGAVLGARRREQEYTIHRPSFSRADRRWILQRLQEKLPNLKINLHGG